MSKNRNRELDRQRTREAIAGVAVPGDAPGKNWLGHGVETAAAKIDAMLVRGATREEMKEARKTAPQHRHHLETEHGLTLIERGGLYVFDL